MSAPKFALSLGKLVFTIVCILLVYAAFKLGIVGMLLAGVN